MEKMIVQYKNYEYVLCQIFTCSCPTPRKVFL